jgi:recombination associated protein RdgC
MSLLSGSISIARYRVVGMNARLSLQQLNETFAPLRLKAVSLKQSRVEMTSGWVKPLGLALEDLPQDADWGLSESRIGDGVLLRMRVEKRKVPNQLLQAMTKQKLAKLEERRQGKPVSRDEKKSIAEEVRYELLERALPQIAHFDAYWSLEQQTVAFFSIAKQARVTFEELFRKSFSQPHGFMLVPVAPPLLGLTPKEWTAERATEDSRLHALGLCVPSNMTLGSVHS